MKIPSLQQAENFIQQGKSPNSGAWVDHAEKLDVSHQSINAIETGKYDPSLPLAFKIARLFGFKIEEIFFPDSTMD